MHILDAKPTFNVGSTVHGSIDWDRRLQLAQHHTSTHIVNAAARNVLGKHIDQASAKKDIEKAHLDITHYKPISEKEFEAIEEEANKIVLKSIKTNLSFMPRAEAEKRYGMTIYQGGAVPGRDIRIVDIPGIDVEACGGSHLNSTAEAGTIKLLKASKIKDGIIRITFVAGNAAKQVMKRESDILNTAAKSLGVKVPQVPARAKELFDVWKTARKAAKKGKKLKPADLKLKSKEIFSGDVLARTADNLQTQPEHVIKTIQRFLKDVEEFKKKVL